MNDELQLLQGTLDVLVLKALAFGPGHGYAIAKWIRTCTDSQLLVEERPLYLCLHRMQARGWVAAEWTITERNRKAKVYHLTAAGRQELDAEMKRWQRYVGAVARVLDAPTPPR